MMRKIIRVLYVSFSLYFVSCNNVLNDESSSKDSIILSKPKKVKENKNYDVNSFESKNYLKLSNLYTGSIFEDIKTKKSMFFRFIEIEEEEHISVYVEKISIGEEGGKYSLLNRFQITEKELGLNNYSLNSLDSLSFNDSTTVSCYFNDSKYKIDLLKMKVTLLQENTFKE